MAPTGIREGPSDNWWPLSENGIDALVALADGSLAIANVLAEKASAIGVPKTIDNDLTRPS